MRKFPFQPYTFRNSQPPKIGIKRLSMSATVGLKATGAGKKYN